MAKLYVGTVQKKTTDPNLVKAVAISASSKEALELTEKWVGEKGNPKVRYKIRICEVGTDFVGGL